MNELIKENSKKNPNEVLKEFVRDFNAAVKPVFEKYPTVALEVNEAPGYAELEVSIRVPNERGNRIYDYLYSTYTLPIIEELILAGKNRKEKVFATKRYCGSLMSPRFRDV
jgi:hypothetical protein